MFQDSPEVVWDRKSFLLEHHLLPRRPGPVLPSPGLQQFHHLLNEALDSVVNPFHPEVCGS